MRKREISKGEVEKEDGEEGWSGKDEEMGGK